MQICYNKHLFQEGRKPLSRSLPLITCIAHVHLVHALQISERTREGGERRHAALMEFPAAAWRKEQAKLFAKKKESPENSAAPTTDRRKTGLARGKATIQRCSRAFPPPLSDRQVEEKCRMKGERGKARAAKKSCLLLLLLFFSFAKKRRGTVTFWGCGGRTEEEEEEGGDFVVGYQGKVERPGKRMLPFQLPPPLPPPSPDRQILERHTRTHRKKRGGKRKEEPVASPRLTVVDVVVGGFFAAAGQQSSTEQRRAFSDDKPAVVWFEIPVIDQPSYPSPSLPLSEASRGAPRNIEKKKRTVGGKGKRDDGNETTLLGLESK